LTRLDNIISIYKIRSRIYHFWN